VGCLMVDDILFCRQIFRLVQSYVGHSIEEIGGIDLSHTLNAVPTLIEQN